MHVRWFLYYLPLFADVLSGLSGSSSWDSADLDKNKLKVVWDVRTFIAQIQMCRRRRQFQYRDNILSLFLLNKRFSPLSNFMKFSIILILITNPLDYLITNIFRKSVLNFKISITTLWWWSKISRRCNQSFSRNEKYQGDPLATLLSLWPFPLNRTG